MNRAGLMVFAAIVLIAVGVYAFRDDLLVSSANGNSGNIKMTEVQVNLNCPIDSSVVKNLMEVYGDNSCPRITIKRLDLKGDNQVTIQPTFSWLTDFKSSFFPLVKEDLEEDINGFRNTALTQNVHRLLNTPQAGSADCSYNAVQANYTFNPIQMNSNNLTAYVNKEVAQGKNKVVFKILKCKDVVLNNPSPMKNETHADNRKDVVKSSPKIEVKVEANKTNSSNLKFEFSQDSNDLLWDPSSIDNVKSKVFEFEFSYIRAGQTLRSGKISFAISDAGKKDITSREILNAGGGDFINHCHNKSCKLTIYQGVNVFQQISISNIDCHIFH